MVHGQHTIHYCFNSIYTGFYFRASQLFINKNEATMLFFHVHVFVWGGYSVVPLPRQKATIDSSMNVTSPHRMMLEPVQLDLLHRNDSVVQPPSFLPVSFCRCMENREPLLAPVLDKLSSPRLPSGDSGQSRQLQAESNRLLTENAGERLKRGCV